MEGATDGVTEEATTDGASVRIDDPQSQPSLTYSISEHSIALSHIISTRLIANYHSLVLDLTHLLTQSQVI